MRVGEVGYEVGANVGWVGAPVGAGVGAVGCPLLVGERGMGKGVEGVRTSVEGVVGKTRKGGETYVGSGVGPVWSQLQRKDDRESERSQRHEAGRVRKLCRRQQPRT